MKHNARIPDWARWIAMDADGSWWAYEAEPHQHNRGWYENEIGQLTKLGKLPDTLAITGSEWRDSLQSLDSVLK